MQTLGGIIKLWSKRLLPEDVNVSDVELLQALKLTEGESSFAKYYNLINSHIKPAFYLCFSWVLLCQITDHFFVGTRIAQNYWY